MVTNEACWFPDPFLTKSRLYTFRRKPADVPSKFYVMPCSHQVHILQFIVDYGGYAVYDRPSPIGTDVHSLRANWSTHALMIKEESTGNRQLETLQGNRPKARPTTYSFVTKISIVPYGYGSRIFVFRRYNSKAYPAFRPG
jgi:hypothetical protein